MRAVGTSPGSTTSGGEAGHQRGRVHHPYCKPGSPGGWLSVTSWTGTSSAHSGVSYNSLPVSFLWSHSPFIRLLKIICEINVISQNYTNQCNRTTSTYSSQHDYLKSMIRVSTWLFRNTPKSNLYLHLSQDHRLHFCSWFLFASVILTAPEKLIYYMLLSRITPSHHLHKQHKYEMPRAWYHE